MSKSKVDLYKMSSSGSQIERINHALKTLNLNGAATFLDIEAKKALKESLTFYDFIENLLEKDMSSKEDGRIRRCIQQARFPFVKTLKDFDFYSENLEEINTPLVQELASCRFIDEKKNIIFLGGTGLGKTHLSISIGVEAIYQGKQVRFIGLRELISLVNKTKQDAEKERRLAATLIRPKLLILDEIGLYNSNPKVSDFLFRVLIQRYENHSSVIFTSNKDVGDWGPLFGDNDRAAVIMDRILQNHEIVVIRGKSYRIEHKSILQTNGSSNIPLINAI